MLGPIAIADVMDRRASRREILIATAFVAAFATLMVVAIRFGDVPGPHVTPFVPICATLWGAGDLLTAYLLLTQFSVNGLRAFAILGAAFAVPGLLTIPYVAFFPGLFFQPPVATGFQQVSAFLWLAWHVLFPVLIGGYHFLDRDLSARVQSGEGIRRWLAWVVVSDSLGCFAIVAIIVVAKDHLPPAIAGASFTALWVMTLAPLVVGINLIAAVAILSSQRPSKLQLWLSVVLLISAMDGLLNIFSSGRYTVTWYVGKLETLATATVVLVILLSEVSSLYRRLGGLASIDFLTGISNRQAFNNDARIALLLQQRRTEDVGFLVIDIDYFKPYNDTYGHQSGDVCLRQVAQCIRKACARSVDLVGRFGGEEFVVMLQGTNAAGAMRVGESIRRCVEALGIVHAKSTVGPVVTVSVGVTHATGERATTLEVLFERADAALYEAKLLRNSVAVYEAPPGVGTLVAEPA